jgi:hypothetical protein
VTHAIDARVEFVTNQLVAGIGFGTASVPITIDVL